MSISFDYIPSTQFTDCISAGLFGLIFSAFAAIGKPHYTFAINGVSLAGPYNSNGVILTHFSGCSDSSICGDAVCTISAERRYKM